MIKIHANTTIGHQVEVPYSSHELTHCLREIAAAVEKKGLGQVTDIHIKLL